MALDPVCVSTGGTDTAHLRQVSQEGLLLILVAPCWPAKRWYPSMMTLQWGLLWCLARTCCHRQGGRFCIFGQSCDLCGLTCWEGESDVVATNQSASAPSTRGLYALKWCISEDCCGRKSLSPHQCPIAGISHVWAYRILGYCWCWHQRNALVICMHCQCVPHASNLRRLDQEWRCTWTWYIRLKSHQGHIVHSYSELPALSNLSIDLEEDWRIHALCPVWVLCRHVEQTRTVCSDQLFLCFANPVQPTGVYAQCMAMSWALFRGVSVEDICAAAQSMLTTGILNQGLSLP